MTGPPDATSSAGASPTGAPAAPAAPAALLEVEGLRKTFGRRTVVDGVRFRVDRGEVVGLLGRNGAGKTTTFRMAVGLERPDSGEVRFAGQEVTRLPVYKRARLGMGYLSQGRSAFLFLSVEDNLRAILERVEPRRADRRRRLDELIARFGLGHVRASLARTLSGGETRRLEIARALVTRPSLLLLDEPFVGIDPITVAEIQGVIGELKRDGMGILITDHHVRETLSTTDRAYIMLDGRILVAGTPAEVIADPTARAVYLGEGFTL